MPRHYHGVGAPPQPREIASYFAAHPRSGELDSPGGTAAEFFDYFEAVGSRDLTMTEKMLFMAAAYDVCPHFTTTSSKRRAP